MSKKKIIFVGGGGGRDQLMFRVAQELKKSIDIEDHYIAQFPNNALYFKEQDIPKEQIHNIFFMHHDKKAPDLKYLRECEKKYTLQLWYAWDVSRQRYEKRSRIPQKKLMAFFEYVLRKTENICDVLRPDYLICVGTDSTDKIIINNVMKARGVEFIELAHARVPNRFTFSNDFVDTWPLLEHYYAQFKEGKLDKKYVSQAKQYIHSFTKAPKRSSIEEKSLKIKDKISSFLNWAKEVIQNKRIPRDFTRINMIVREKVLRRLPIFDRVVAGEKFVFFPLHYQPEAATLIYGKWHDNQLSVIQNLAKSLPIDHMLYVKEHPSQFGNRPWYFYKEVKKIPNVRMLHPDEKTFEVIKNCSIVVSISGTAGFEGILFGKPVIALGQVYYSCADIVYKFSKWDDMPAAMASLIGKRSNQDDVEGFVGALFAGTFEGKIVYNWNWYEGDADKVARGVLSYMDFLKTQNRKK